MTQINLTYTYNVAEQHEHLGSFGILNMNGRIFDPNTATFFSPDPFVQAPYNSQNFNRYSYCLNNPLMYTDPSGELWFLVAAAAVFGAYSGGSMANGTLNPFKWDYSSGKTWGYMLGGAVVGGLSAGVGSVISTSGVPFANTLAIMGGSLTNSVGTWMYTGGQTDITMSLGFGSINFTTGKFSTFSTKNSWYENLGYGLGALANLRDINNLFDQTTANLFTQNRNSIEDGGGKDFISHTGIKSASGETLMSFGPDSDAKLPGKLGFAIEPKLSTPNYPIYPDLSLKSEPFVVNKYLFRGLKTVSKIIPFQGLTTNCVNISSLGLWLNGIPNIGIHPYLLHGSMHLYNSGIYNVISSRLYRK